MGNTRLDGRIARAGFEEVGVDLDIVLRVGGYFLIRKDGRFGTLRYAGTTINTSVGIYITTRFFGIRHNTGNRADINTFKATGAFMGNYVAHGEY